MNSQEGFDSVPHHPVFAQLLPLQMQPGLPMPFLCQGQPMIFVPFFSIWPVDGGIACSHAQFHAVFSLPTRKLILFANLLALSRVDHGMLGMASPSDTVLRRLQLSSQQLLHDLDCINLDLAAGRMIESERLAAYREKVLRSLIISEQKSMYEGVNDDSYPCV